MSKQTRGKNPEREAVKEYLQSSTMTPKKKSRYWRSATAPYPQTYGTRAWDLRLRPCRPPKGRPERAGPCPLSTGSRKWRTGSASGWDAMAKAVLHVMDMIDLLPKIPRNAPWWKCGT